MYMIQRVVWVSVVVLALGAAGVLGTSESFSLEDGSGDASDELMDVEDVDIVDETVKEMDHEWEEEEEMVTVDPDAPIEIAFSFDTTGSMYPVLERVRNVLADMISRLQSDIPGIRLAVLAHGDYQDARTEYDVTSMDFTTDADQLIDFVRSVRRTGGGDMPECYEYALRKAQEDLSWTAGSQRSLVMIGDAAPHEPSYPANQLRINWRNEASTLREMRVRVYAIKALSYSTESFYREVASVTRGYYLQLANFDSIFDFIMAISYRESGVEFLNAYEAEVRSRDGGISSELTQLFATLRQQRVVRRPSSHTPSTPATHTDIHTTTRPGRQLIEELDIYELHIRTVISYRFASSRVEWRVANRRSAAQQANFFMTLTKAAFITNFTMEIDGMSYPGVVREKERARREYQAAVERGESAAQIIAAPRNTNSFKVSVNVAAGDEVKFTLHYQELVERRLGVYEHLIHVDPGQLVRNLTIDVGIDESRDITSLRVPPLRNDLLGLDIATDVDPHTTITRPSARSARIHYSPSTADQLAASEQGVAGQFIVQYDLHPIANEIKVVDGYFIHFYAPPNLPIASKNVMFVLDTSGSMRGTKITQLKDAMTSILDQLATTDTFNIISFSSFMRSWKSEGLVEATAEHIQDAKTWVSNMFAAGGTNIDRALERAMQLLDGHTTPQAAAATSLIVFLTDGQPTDGVTDKRTILDNVRRANHARFTLYSLGFGVEVDFPFLQQLALQNDGMARRIYADADADLQLSGFYSEIASPVLTDVNVTYLNDIVNVTTLTETTQSVHFNGTELVICGILKSDLDQSVHTLHSKVIATGSQGDIEFYKQVPIQTRQEPDYTLSVDGTADGEEENNEEQGQEAESNPASGAELRDHFRRMWAYLTIKKLLSNAKQSMIRNEKSELRARALELSLDYNFVTTLTSMVVTRPDETSDVQDLVDSDRTDNDGGDLVADTERPPPPSDTISTESLDDHRPSASGAGRGRGRYRHPARESAISRLDADRRSFADSDPHFLLWTKDSDTRVCFDLAGQPGESYQLIADPSINLVVNGFIVGNHPRDGGKARTYFGEVAIVTSLTRLVINSEAIFLHERRFEWRVNSGHAAGDVSYDVKAPHRLLVVVSNVHLLVIRHKVHANNRGKVDFLGVYVDDGTAFSNHVTGLIGQFQRLRVQVDDEVTHNGKTHAQLTFPDEPQRPSVVVHKGGRRNLATKVFVTCWFARKGGLHLIEGSAADYRVPYLHYDQLAPGLSHPRLRQ